MINSETTMEQRLNALADGELDAAESEELLDIIEQNAELSSQLCDIHRIKDMLHYAYPDEQNAEPLIQQTSHRRLGWAVAATLIFTLGTLVGSLVRDETRSIAPFSLAQVESQQADKIVLFVNDSDKEKFQLALDKAQYFLKTAGSHDVEVNIVASAGGIDMFRNGISPISGQIRMLAENYDALQFIACSKTIANKKLEGKPVNLVREASVASSAVEFIVGRLQDGWSYVAI